ncbi:MAG: cell wall hydrolase [Allosphingosinicella sp.]|uniref:cell wall hydrolase n=1 Tax=Allosphingosinicella sp. TaxID=2823234 RepID=UPI00395AF456
MIRSVRAAGIAAAVFGAASLLFGGPSFAWQGDFAPAVRYTAHATAGFQDEGFGLNGIDAGKVDAGKFDAGRLDAIGGHALASFTERMVALADAAVPRPRSLEEQVSAYSRVAVDNAEQECLANAVYFEARGEPLPGQLAVAEVVLNRVASKKYPNTICEVVVQPWQFSFINPRTGVFPKANRASAAWKKSVAIARLAEEKRATLLPTEVLWYHADYVAPGWGKRLTRETKIGLHIFYT